MPTNYLLNETQENYYDNVSEDYGNYQFTSLTDIINQFMLAYVGEEKIIPRAKRADVAFHAQRAMQELSFDTFKSVKSQEIEIGPQLYMVLPKNYVNYVKLTWVDDSGIERIIYPAIKTSNPIPIVQDDDYEYTFDQTGEIIEASESETLRKFKSKDGAYSGSTDPHSHRRLHLAGRRYGLDPQYAQSNGVFYIDQIQGLIHFSSDLCNKIVTLKYISDGVAGDEDKVVHKFAEEAIYKYIAHAVLATRFNTPEYLVARFKREAAVAKRNAKLRLSNIKLEELSQTLRGKSKHIKH